MLYVGEGRSAVKAWVGSLGGPSDQEVVVSLGTGHTDEAACPPLGLASL